MGILGLHRLFIKFHLPQLLLYSLLPYYEGSRSPKSLYSKLYRANFVAPTAFIGLHISFNCLLYGGGGETRTPAPSFNRPTRLAIMPLHQLGYASVSNGKWQLTIKPCLTTAIAHQVPLLSGSRVGIKRIFHP